MVHELEVWLFADHVGTLSLQEGRLSFHYRENWLNRPGAVALSCSLPLQSDAFDDIHTRPFFAGLLPEGHLRRLIAQQFQVSGQNDFALLDHIGGECAGAITFLPPGASPSPSGDDHVQWLNDDELIAILDELPRRPMMAGKDGLRLSLAGVQDKLPVVFDGQRIGLPQGGQPSTHILKPLIHGVEDSVTNEGFCLALACAMKLQAAQAQIRTIVDRRFLLVARYDRQTGTQGRVARLHQEDFCQALGVVPEMKYQNEGGPDLAACFSLLRHVTRPSAPQVLHLLDYVVFNALIGNHDAHAKNFSLLYTAKFPVLAPLYDTLSTAVYQTLTPKMAMKIGSKYKFSEVQAHHWDQFAESAGLGRAQTRKRILELAQSLPKTARQLQSQKELEFAGNPLVEQIITLIEQRAALTIRRLTEPQGDA
ncbi:type II toxin-antitoxin system HipA family toxin [Nitrosomonas oligotropha]|uniref:Serine/threonine-protein kinase HipA n=1 Tax=Nitrosomonas oligotropha TaxID=42354 RepID=A0A1H8L4G5_9PROT|nr:type II toxin-antitoxin system HipA family toxin [Nitrosomonas oligotropha]SDW18172.1 serine/threonine-protein kinase HipA [Nitrosomonas oligotropha]SEN99558.1 serine/threonine-protein kinase HipA [Nitrosomonas oligotropha]